MFSHYFYAKCSGQHGNAYIHVWIFILRILSQNESEKPRRNYFDFRDFLICFIFIPPYFIHMGLLIL